MRFSLNDEGVHMLIRLRKTIQGVHMCIFMRFSLNAEGVPMFISFENKTLLSDLLFLKSLTVRK